MGADRTPSSTLVVRPAPADPLLPAYAFSRAAMSSLDICSIASVVRAAFTGSGSLIRSMSLLGTTCQDRPNLSLSQPQGPPSPPSSMSLFQ